MEDCSSLFHNYSQTSLWAFKKEKQVKKKIWLKLTVIKRKGAKVDSILHNVFETISYLNISYQ